MVDGNPIKPPIRRIKMFDYLQSILKEEYFKALISGRNEDEVIDLLFEDVINPTLIKNDNDVATYQWNYEFKGYSCKDNCPHLLTFEWQEKGKNDMYYIVNLKVLL